MAETVVSIHRNQDLRSARALAEYVRCQRGWPASTVTTEVVEKLADMLGDFWVERRAAIASFKAEFEADVAALRAEMKLGGDRIEAALDAAEAFVAARGKLNEALAMLHAPIGPAAQPLKEQPSQG